MNRNFDENSVDEPISDPQKRFEVEFFNPLIDLVQNELDERFSQLDMICKYWSFLFDRKKLPEREQLLKCCTDLDNKLSIGDFHDLNGIYLCDELLSLRNFLLRDENQAFPLFVLNYTARQKNRRTLNIS